MPNKKKLTKVDRNNQLDEAKLFEIAVMAVRMKGIRERNPEMIETEIKLAYAILKRVADGL